MKVTKAQFGIFSAQVHYWLSALGLNDWRVTLYQRHVRDGWAEVTSNPTTGVAMITLTDKIEDEQMINFSPADIAKHEVLHLLLRPLEHMACPFGQGGDAITVETHRIVNRLSKVLQPRDTLTGQGKR